MYFTNAGGGSGCWIRKVTPCGIIITIAGTGSCGYNGDGILATSAQLNNPLSIAFDSVDNLYFGEQSSNRVRKIDAITGLISTVAGNGSAGFSGDGGMATAAKLNEPGFISFDRWGNLYIIDEANYRIRKVNASGIISTIAGNPIGPYTDTTNDVPADSTEISDDYGICTDTAGSVFFGDDNYFRLRKVDTAGIINTIAGDGSYMGGRGPRHICRIRIFRVGI